MQSDTKEAGEADRDNEKRPDRSAREKAREDAAIIERFRAGDLSAFDEIVVRHQARLYGLVYHMTGHPQDAEDVLQAVFLRAYRALPRFRGQSALSTWLHRIAVNTSLNHLKRRKRHAASLDEPEAGVERRPEYIERASRKSPVRDISLAEFQEKLNAALQTLSDKHRAVVVLHDIEGLPHEEIARMMRCSVGTIRSRLFYARRLLQVELAEFAP